MSWAIRHGKLVWFITKILRHIEIEKIGYWFPDPISSDNLPELADKIKKQKLKFGFRIKF